MHRFFEELDSSKRLSNKEKKRIRPNEHFLIKMDKKIVSICNLHATSENYAQLGGVLTLPEYRNHRLATKCVSMFCKKYFEKGFNTIILFTSKENIPAIKVYKKIGFKNAENFIIGRY